MNQEKDMLYKELYEIGSLFKAGFFDLLSDGGKLLYLLLRELYRINYNKGIDIGYNRYVPMTVEEIAYFMGCSVDVVSNLIGELIEENVVFCQDLNIGFIKETRYVFYFYIGVKVDDNTYVSAKHVCSVLRLSSINHFKKLSFVAKYGVIVLIQRYFLFHEANITIQGNKYSKLSFLDVVYYTEMQPDKVKEILRELEGICIVGFVSRKINRADCNKDNNMMLFDVSIFKCSELLGL